MICTGQGVAPSWPIIYLYLGRPTVIIPTMVPDKVPIVAVTLSLLIWSSRPTLVVPSRRFHRQRRRQWFPGQELRGVALRFFWSPSKIWKQSLFWRRTGNMTKGPHTWPKEKKTWREVYQEWLESDLQPGGLMLDAINQNKEKIRRKQVLRRKWAFLKTWHKMFGLTIIHRRGSLV